MTLHTTYFGSVDWYAALLCADEPVTIDTAEHYIKQTTRNHCLIATAGGVQKLTVPVTVPSATAGHGKPLTRDVRISDHGNWRHLHWQALSSAYGQSPFFDYYADDIRPFFEQRWEFLVDYNQAITEKMSELIGKPYPTLINEEKQKTKTYYQTFQRRHGFIAGLSILDLLFNMGPEAILILSNN
ncbi:MAG: WbqC family protein [Prevotella sp.]|nr:WbqC family protein [Prevotella sp.]MBR6190756.1 WbqC family protein [Prevotella sp.]